jgi:hypothetical protein
MNFRLPWFVLLIAAAMATAPFVRAADPLDADHSAKMAKGVQLFTDHVRPVLLAKCFKCHGGESVESSFDMTDRDKLLKGGDNGIVVLPGKARESLLFQQVSHQTKPHMPYEQDKLPDAAIEQIGQWIDLGAPYDRPLKGAAETPWTEKVISPAARKFWSFQPLASVAPPAVKQGNWPRTPVDRFVLAKMEASGVVPNPPASKRQLIRRVYFDLIGLPPSPEEIEAFEHDNALNAYEKVVDRLLASRHFGERWARRWLDVSRFAESHGFEHDYDRPTAYPFRDFVIRAINDDLPFDTFVKWQLAGDEYAPDNAEANAATGFLAAGVHSTQITKNEVERQRYDELDDMMATMGTGMLGLTIGCCRCHDHKYDPLPQRDYYRLLSAFTTTVRSEADLDMDPAANKKLKEQFDREQSELVAAVKRFETEHLPARLAAWEKERRDKSGPVDPWKVLEPTSIVSAGGATFMKLDDGSYLATGANARFDVYTIVAATNLSGVTSIRLEALADPSMVRGGPGRAANGNFDLTNLQITAAPTNAKHSGAPITLHLRNPRATFEQPGLPIKATIDDNPNSGWAVDPQFGRNHAAVYELDPPLNIDGGDTVLTFTLSFHGNDQHNIGRLRLSVSNAAPPVELTLQSLPSPIATALDMPQEKRTAAQTQSLLNWYRGLDPDWQRFTHAAEEHAKHPPQLKTQRTLVASEGLTPIRLHTQGADFFNETYFLKRGDVNQKAGVAPLGFPQVLDTAPEGDKHWIQTPPAGWRTSYRRRSVAEWMTDPKYGGGALLARVAVNRLWQGHFGRGIVATPSDFGTRGEPPSHPELLDWLADELIHGGWRLKPLHKQMVMSAAYIESCESNEADAKLDPDNHLIWRHPTQRLEAEVIRDALLSVSGRLDATMYGPGTLDTASRRRSIYFTVKRSQLIPMMTVFDGPDALNGIGQRSTTTVAPQALYLMNDPQVREYAKTLAMRVAPKSDTSLDAAIRSAYLYCLGRPPADDEAADSLAFINQQIASYKKAGKTNARELGLADFCQTVLCLNEFVYIE